MPVNIYNPSPSGSGGVRIPLGTQQPTRFQDLFTRANASNLGAAWLQTYFTESTSGAQLIASIVSNAFSMTSTGSNTCSGILAPIQLAWMSQLVRNQFSEITIGVSTVTVFGYGPICAFSPQMAANSANQGFYLLQWNNTNLQIVRSVYNGSNNTGSTMTTLATIVQTVTTGDVLRLEATNVSGTWTLTAKKNGTVIGSTTDNILIQGMPGIYSALAQPAVPNTVTLTEYAGGTL